MEIIDWLMTPISGSLEHNIEPWTFWHARLMVFAWSIAVPLGILAARFFKVMPGQIWPEVKDNKAWWRAHRGLQYSGITSMLIGLALAWNRGQTADSLVATVHARLGWVVITLGVLQILVAWARGSKGGPTDKQMAGDHYDMTPWRLTFEWVHKSAGYLALLLSVVVVFTGLAVADAPRWMWLVLILWWLGLFALFAHLQRQGRCIDTYQAIWGPDTGTHASKLRPTGWGVRRYTATEWEDAFARRKSTSVGTDK